MRRFDHLFSGRPALIGVVHLPPLPGYDTSPGLQACIDHALRDLAVYEAAGFSGVLIENEWDRPHRVLAGPETIAAMTVITRAVVAARHRIPIGVEVLLNDPQASLAIAAAGGADFIRTDYFVDRMARADFGEMQVDPAALMDYRRQIDAEHVLVLADIQVKYAQMLERRGIDESAHLAAVHGADAIIVTGTVTGEAPLPTDLELASAASTGIPLLIGSGLSPHNAVACLAMCRGAIVGSALMSNGRADMNKARQLRGAMS